jgi:hypothetical protein
VRPLHLALFLLAVLPAAVSGAGLEDSLNARWRGNWVVVRTPIFSSCDGFYNDNEVRGTRVESTSRRRFTEGEVARVERIGVKRNRVDVFLDLAEGVLAERHDGPFTLYDPLTCKIQLKFPIPDRAQPAAVEDTLAELLELHQDRNAAERSPGWNRRRQEPFPEGYEKTLAAYQAWKAAQLNAAVQARMDRAIDDSTRITDRIRSDKDYLDGFAAGVERTRDRSFSSDCGSLVNDYFSPDSGSGRSSSGRNGYEDGQRLAYNLELLRHLQDCFVPVPQ